MWIAFQHPADAFSPGNASARARLGRALMFAMQDPSQIPPTVEPLFQAGEATVSLTPVMTAEGLQAGLQEALG
jgi:hypothetical protein